ncbi:unnamed protein product [Fraxinus pennsylvanica]|uniref:Uncharacterized protein n=1 Tax=Fraxinus pennsylvanica TaxID=56036 RepID=A0AAD2DPL6_9LAMI|nr:unnamed protein product [Fraxinus pennsylvanica]
MTSAVSKSQGVVPPAGFGVHELSVAGSSASFVHSEAELTDNEETELHSVSWTQEFSCFVETFRRDLKSGGFRIVEMIFRCNILALVGSKTNSQYPSNKVIIWDDHQSRCIGEFSFRSKVRAVKLSKDRVVIVVEHKIYVYNFMDSKLLCQIDSGNPQGTLLPLTPLEFICVCLPWSATTTDQVRREVDKEDIYSIALSPNVQWFRVTKALSTYSVSECG